MKEYCVTIAHQFSRQPSIDSVIRDMSGCVEKYVRFADTVAAPTAADLEDQIDPSPKLIGVCHFDTQTYKCISKGPNQYDIILYNLSQNVCDPLQLLENFSEPQGSELPCFGGNCTIL